MQKTKRYKKNKDKCKKTVLGSSRKARRLKHANFLENKQRL
jgi:hypothetical protein